MLYDRPYMRQDEYRKEEFPILKWLLLTNLGVFIGQCILERWFGTAGYTAYFALQADGIRRGFFWTLVSYSFFHSTVNILHILLNLLCLFIFGRVIQPVIGATRLLTLYLGSAILGGLTWLVFNFTSTVPVLGASAAALGILTVYCLLFPENRVTVLLFFIIPVTLKPKHLGWITLFINLFGFLFNEIAPGGGHTNVAYSAHLGGMFAGWFFYSYIHNRVSSPRRKRPAVELPNWFKRSPTSESKERNFKINITNRKHVQEEVDRILDKINTHGFGSLSDEEKRILDRAKDILSR